jgi:RHS repeat-associated protein
VFDAAGNLLSVKYPNGITNQYAYDPLNRLINMSAGLRGAQRADFTYSLKSGGTRTNLADNVGGTSRAFSWSYDSLYRLTNETVSGATTGTLTNVFDGVGNRTSRAGSLGGLGPLTSTFDANDQVDNDSNPNNANIWYDANGNMKTNGAAIYAYDWANRLVAYTNGTTTNGITYDSAGNRIKKITPNGSTVYLVAEVNPTGYPQVVEESTVSGSTTNLSKVYTYGLARISQRQISGNLVTFYGYDGLGSVRYLADTSGTIQNTYAYDAFGNAIVSNAAVANVYLFAGEQFDLDLKLSYNRARYWDPSIGRFLTMDTFEGRLEDPLSLHKYLYCKANPVNGVDPSGHDEIDWGMTVFISPLWSLGKMIAGDIKNGPPTHVGDVLNEYFSPFSHEKVWIMGPTDHYTQIVRKWQSVITAVDDAKTSLRSNPADWDAHHKTTSSWKPGAAYVMDQNAWQERVANPPGTDPDTAKREFSYWKKTGIQTDALYIATIGSFEVFVTANQLDLTTRKAVLNVWMFNLMDRRSFGRFAQYAVLSGQANQWMWWNWTEDYTW